MSIQLRNALCCIALSATLCFLPEAAFSKAWTPDSPAAPEITITGKVTEETGESLPGVNVLVKGTTSGTTTDSDGNYTLVVPDNGTALIFSCIGYVTPEVSLDT